mgnify:FL=1
MVVQQEIHRLKSLGHSQRRVAKILGIYRGSVAKYWDTTILCQEPSPPSWVLKVDWKYVQAELSRHVPRKILYEELRESHKLPSYSNFCRYLGIQLVDAAPGPEITMRITREPGYSLEVDYAGDTWPILNPSTGEIYQAQLFVGAMSYSSYFYAEFTMTQKLEDFIGAHTRMFTFFGGVPLYLIPDNCKTAVIKADKYDPIVNETYHDMCVHYGTTVDPARAYHPKDKPTVERTVGILQQDFFPRIRNKTYTSLYELNRDLLQYILEKATVVMKERGKSRAELFDIEKLHLRALCVGPYEIYHFKTAKLHPDCHIQHEKNFYSAPYRHVGKDVNVRYNQCMVYIYVDTECVAIHPTAKGHGHFVTNEAHYPEKKIADLHMSILSCKAAARKVGPNTDVLVERLFQAARHPLKNLRKVQGIITLTKQFDRVAFEYAADVSVLHNKLFYAYIKQCAKNYRPPKEISVLKAPSRQLELVYLQGGKE